ncbi:protein-glutamate methylesterase/protein-glutamine glutaminase [Candidatus Acetatifactor stercoripullorum]|uniref:protein-glutamate methylesterase/protein-glutamine glutaminase n=1 Tax=Candidatus Acetatifactor stercoripullorum TaxID=2838414 RepID=UPI00298DB5E6|nr:chemotaxis response regulator protein-glutamate methylesterase [Candidatus Acetatifactor stercoripullorum]
MPKKILVVDDSALMRRVLCDIINSDKRFQVVARATNGLEAFDLLSRNQYDAVVLDVNMPKMNGLELLKELRKFKISAKVMMASTDTREGAKTTLDALELGALDFIHKPDSAIDCRVDAFKTELLRILDVVANSKPPVFESEEKIRENRQTTSKMVDIVRRHTVRVPGRKVVAIASSTGGPKALQSVIPKLPKELDTPVLVVQHMPKGFTASLAERLNDLSSVAVREAKEGDELEAGVVYIAMGGMHMNVKVSPAGRHTIHYSDEPAREGVKPCANYMYESLAGSRFDNVVCVVMTGMGADGTEGIKNLKAQKQVHVIAQDQNSSTVFGMPKSVINAGLSDQVVPLEQIAQEIILHVGVKTSNV